LISGELNTYRLDEQSELAGIVLNVPVFQLVLIDTGDMEKKQYMLLMEQFCKEEGRRFYCFWDSNMNLVLLFMGECGCDNEAEKKIVEVLRRQGLLYHTFVCIGKSLKSYQQIANSYRICCDFLNMSSAFANRIVRTEEYPYEKYLFNVKEKKVQQLIESININRIDEVIHIVHKMAEACPSKEERRKELVSLTIFLYKYICPIRQQRNIVMPEECLEAQSTTARMEDWMEHFFSSVMNSRDNKDNYHPHVMRALQEINRSYGDNNVSLQEIAKLCHVSSAYLGKLFKAQTGEFFNDYLLKVRLKAAEVLLYEGKLRIGAIAEQVGFSNQSYFNKMFRKDYGISPAEYRRQCHKEQGE